MANIIVNASEFICQTPIFGNVSYTGTQYEINLNWTSLGSYYATFDPNTVMTLYMELNRVGVPPYFSGFINSPIPFDGVNFLVNVLDYSNLYSGKDNLVFTLKLSNSGCDNSVTYNIPPDTIP